MAEQNNPATQQSELDLEHLLDAFEEAMHATGDDESASVHLPDFLPAPNHRLYDQAVVELIRIQLEHRRFQGQQVELGEYIEMFPDTFAQSEPLRTLAFEDFRLRCQLGEEVYPVDYRQRYEVDTTGWPSRRSIMESASPAAAAQDQDGYPAAGDRICGFQIITEFDRGAFSRVYLAQQGNLSNRLVVLKMSKQFWNESDLLARLQHTNIVPIHSVHHHNDMQVVCMPFWGTCTLADVLKKLRSEVVNAPGSWTAEMLHSTIANHQNETVVSALYERRLDNSPPHSVKQPPRKGLRPAGVKTGKPSGRTTSYVESCLSLVVQIADALSHAHQRSIIHRDLKPANVLLADDGRPMVLDFNLSTAANAIQERAIGGTLPYMSPEQLLAMNGEAVEAQPASDVYSLGVILFELLTGQRPFPDRQGQFETIVDTMLADRARVPSLRKHNRDIPSGVDAIVQRCLCAKVMERYPTAAHLRDDVQRHLANKRLCFATETLSERTRKWYRRNARMAWRTLTAGCCIMALAALAGWWRQAYQANAAQAQSRYRQFVSDADWVAGVLSTSGIDQQQHAEAEQLASEWFDTYAMINETNADHLEGAAEPGELRQHLGQFMLSVAGAKLTQARKATSEADHKALSDEATKLNARAEQIIGATAAVLLQRSQLQNPEDVLQTIPTAKLPVSERSASYYELLGSCLAREGRHQESLEAHEAAKRLAPKDYSNWVQLGNAYRRLYAWGDAEKCFEICIALRPEVPFGYFQLGLAHLEQGKFREAEQDFSRFLRERPESAAGRFNLALAYQGLGKVDAARDLLLELEDSGVSGTRLLLLLADLCHTSSDRHNGQRYHALALQSVPIGELGWLSRGMAHLKSGDAKQALEDFKQALACQHTSVNAMKNIAHVLSDHLDRIPEAIDQMDRAIELHPTDAELISSRGVLLARLGETKAAQDDIRVALANDQGVTTLLRAGCIFALTSESDDGKSKAIEYVRRGIAKDPRWAHAIEKDPDLRRVQADERFQSVMHAARTLIGEN